MEISLTFQHDRPPAGTLRVVLSDPAKGGCDESAGVVFSGWLELLRVLDALLETCQSDGVQS